MIHYSPYSTLETKSGVLVGRGWGWGISAWGLKDYLKLPDSSINAAASNFLMLKAVIVFSRAVGSPAHTFHSPALQGVEFAHQFDQWVGGWFGHQGGDGACAGGLRGAAVPLCSVWARRVLQGPTLKTLGRGGGGDRQGWCKVKLHQNTCMSAHQSSTALLDSRLVESHRSFFLNPTDV